MKVIKRFGAVLAVFVLLSCTGCAGHSMYMKPATTLLQPTENEALVRFMRPSGLGFAVNFNVLDGEKVIGNSVAMSQFDYLVEPGKHLFIATAENKVFLEADLEAGKTYYVITRIYPGAWYARVAFVAVNKNSKFWDKVYNWEEKLKIIEPNTAALKKWESKNKGKIDNLISAYEGEWKNKYDWPVLRPEDGR